MIERDFFRELSEHEKQMVGPEAEAFARHSREAEETKARLIRMLSLLEPGMATDEVGFDVGKMAFYRNPAVIEETG